MDGLTDALVVALERLHALDLRLVALAVVLQLANVALRGAAWWSVLRAAHPGRRVPLGCVLCAYTAGMAANTVLPARGGDGVKAVLVRQRLPGACLATIAGTMLVTALFDAVAGALALAGAWSAGLAPLPQPPGRPALWVGATALLAVGGAALLRGRVRARVGAIAADVRLGGAILRTPRRYLAQVVSLQACAWGCRVGIAYALLYAFHIQASLGQAVAVVVLGGLSAAVPGTPGGAGTQQLLVVYALQRVASAAVALSFAVGMQAGIATLNAALGVCALLVLFRTARPLAALRATRALAG